MDWFDWMLPEAWNVEHNNLHHYHLGEDSDPDLLERNMQDIRGMDAPMWQKYAAVTFLAATWKWFYYSPNTFKELKMKELRRKGVKIVGTDHANEGSPWTPEMAISWAGILTPNYLPSWFSVTEYLIRVFIPYAVYRFVVLPLPFLFIGQQFGSGYSLFINAVLNAMIADVVTNLHGFLCIVTNHAGNDLYRFEKHCRPRSGEFYLRQVISSADFAAGDDVTDFLHGWLNYQIEHHLWPDLTMLSYQKSMPEVKKICKRHGVPYIQESVWVRLKKTVDIMVGNTSMRQYPLKYENPAADTRKIGDEEPVLTGHGHGHGHSHSN
jgi:fatty acid desaturase